MPGRLSLSQRLTRPDGVPTAAARLGVVALMAVAAATGYAAGPDGSAAPATASSHGGPVAISRLAGDLPIATPEPRPALRAAPALPAIQRPTPAATPAAMPSAAAEPAPSAARTPVVAPAPPVPAPPASSNSGGRRAPTPTETFDSSG